MRFANVGRMLLHLLGLIFVAVAQAASTGVVITTDCGTEIDDQWAIVHLAQVDTIDLRAIVTNFAPEPQNLDSETTASCAREALAKVGRDVPVYAGSSRKLGPERTEAPLGARRLLEISRDYDSAHRLVVVGLGTMTDYAAALRLDPQFADRTRIVALAFDAFPEGGDGYNVQNDVRAWQEILPTNVPITIITGPLAMKHLYLTVPQAESTLGGTGAVGAWLRGLHRTWIQNEGDFFAQDNERVLREQGVDWSKFVKTGRDVWPIWDEAVTATILGFTHEKTQPRPKLHDDITFEFPNDGRTWQVVDEIDRDALFADLRARLQALAPCTGVTRVACFPTP